MKSPLGNCRPMYLSAMILMRESPSPAHFCLATALVGEHIRALSTRRVNACTAQILSAQRSTSQPIHLAPESRAMHVSLFAKLVLVASIVAPVLSTPIACAVIPLDLAIPADLFLAFVATLRLFPATRRIAPTGTTALVLETRRGRGRGPKLEKSSLRDESRLLASVIA